MYIKNQGYQNMIIFLYTYIFLNLKKREKKIRNQKFPVDF